MMIPKAIQTAAWRVPFARKWMMIFYAKRRTGYALPDLINMWAKAKADFTPGRTSFLGERAVEDDFALALAHRKYEESDTYRCAYGCCTILWYRGEDTGGMGAAGCQHDQLAEPRDLAHGIIRKGKAA